MDMHTTISEAIKLPPSISIAPDIYGGFSLYVPMRMLVTLQRPDNGIYRLLEQVAQETGYWFRVCCGDTVLNEVGTKPKVKIEEQMINLYGADYIELWQHLLEERQRGKIVIITDNVTNRCLHTNDLLTPTRAVWTPAQFHNYDYLICWRSQRAASAREGVNPEYFQLKDLLERDRVVRGYDYHLFRPGDDKVKYQTDYYLVENYPDTPNPVRIGVSDPLAYEVVEYA